MQKTTLSAIPPLSNICLSSLQLLRGEVARTQLMRRQLMRRSEEEHYSAKSYAFAFPRSPSAWQSRENEQKVLERSEGKFAVFVKKRSEEEEEEEEEEELVEGSVEAVSRDSLRT